jgi:hypothetical protein
MGPQPQIGRTGSTDGRHVSRTPSSESSSASGPAGRFYLFRFGRGRRSRKHSANRLANRDTARSTQRWSPSLSLSLVRDTSFRPATRVAAPILLNAHGDPEISHARLLPIANLRTLPHEWPSRGSILTRHRSCVDRRQRAHTAGCKGPLALRAQRESAAGDSRKAAGITARSGSGWIGGRAREPISWLRGHRRR